MPLANEGPLVPQVVPELEDQAFPFQRGLALAEDFFHVVVPPEVEVDEVAVGAAVYRPTHGPDLVLALDVLAVLAKRDVRYPAPTWPPALP